MGNNSSPSSKDGSFSIIDAGDSGVGGIGDGTDPNNEVVEINDNSTSTSLVMEHNYTNQEYGSVEFWVMSNNTNKKVWVFCLMQNDILALAIMMNDNEWQYTINDIIYYNVQNVGAPENNTWFHVRIDFRCTGADSYFSLQENKFNVYINTVVSPQYTFTTLTSINKTRVTTGGSDTGVAYMDAIGYSWDPYYEVGTNRYPIVHYPEKTLIWFSASLTIDTSSDIDSLDYFWDFGDGSSDYGKYISHEYVTSGMYPVELTVIDDNGNKASKTRIVLISNNYPDINFTSSQGTITTYEGTTVTFDTITDDENADISRMEYFWHLDGSEFDPYNVSQYEQGGWVNSYTFTDDHEGNLFAMARDPEGAFDFDKLNITILNVDPTVSIYALSVIANITFEVERSGPPYYENNFTFFIQGTDKFGLNFPYLVKILNFTDSEESIVNYREENVILSLLKDWKVIINTSSQIFGNVRYCITLQFQDGQQEEIFSSWFSSGYANWELSLNPLWYDDTNYTIKHPIEMGVSIWDPSTDDITFDLNYSVNLVLEIECTDSLPIKKSFNISDTYFYDVYVYESNGKKYVNISAYTQVAVSHEFNGYAFPISIYATYSLEPIIDITELLINHPDGPQLNGFSVADCISALNFLNAFAKDDDGGNFSVVVNFDTQDGINVLNLCPDIELIIN